MAALFQTILEKLYGMVPIKQHCKFQMIHSLLQTATIEHVRIAQQHYHAFRCLAYRWRIRTSVTHNLLDFSLSPIDTQSRHAFPVYQGRNCYWFYLWDLRKHWMHSLTNLASYLFCSPVDFRNPYTNLPFRKSDLYNIYFRMKDTMVTIPPLLTLYFQMNFSIHVLCKYHLNDFLMPTVDDFMKNGAEEDILFEEDNMVIELNLDRQMFAHLSLKPYVRLYLLSKYSANVIWQEVFRRDLVQLLNQQTIPLPTKEQKEEEDEEQGQKEEEEQPTSYTYSFMTDHLYL
jgi:hypothetical protein